MNHAPVVSVVMPAFNAERTIGLAIASVLEQTFTDTELLVCDDASTDGTVTRVKSLGDPRIRLLESERNAGPGAARDRCIAAASGKWIALLDADDAWAPERLQRLLDAAGGDDGCMVFDDVLVCHDVPGGPGAMVPWRRLHGTHAFGTAGRQPREVPLASYIRSERLLIQQIMPLRVIRDRQLRHSQRRFGEDAEFFLKLAATGLRLRYVPDPLYWYRVTPGSATAEARDPVLMRESLAECASLPGFDPAARTAFADKLRQLREHEALRLAAGALRARNLRAALTAVAQQPRSLLRVPRLLLRRIGYELHRLASGGRRR